MKFLQGLPVLVLGLGESGLAMARWCARWGARVSVADSRENPPHAHTLRRELPQVQLRQGVSVDVLGEARLVLKSPGLSPHDPALQPLLAAARERGIDVQGELHLFARALEDLRAEREYAPSVLAVTGTNGKTTTTSLTARLVAGCGKRVGLAGNIGPTLLDTLAAALDQEIWPERPAPMTLARGEAANDAGADQTEAAPDAAPPDATSVETPSSAAEAAQDHDPAQASAESASPADGEETPAFVLHPPPPPPRVFSHLPEVWVLELSSFQLDGVQGFEPTAATVLNITQDHLDWHGTMAAYAEAKSRIYGQHAVMVVNVDEPDVVALAERIAHPPAPTGGVRGKAPKTAPRRVVRFGLCAPEHPGDFGWTMDGSVAWLVRALESDPGVKLKKGETEDLVIKRLMPADALLIPGRHNVSNALAALALATAAGCPLAPMLHVLREYRGEPHRVQHVATVGGVSVFDDSKGTNVGATVAALKGLGPDLAPNKLVLILGGDGKGQDFAPLQEPVRRHVRAAALIGRDAARLREALANEGVTLADFDTLEAATRWAFEQAQSGDALLLSPACASLDMFRNYEHRAEVFVNTVRDLAADRGEVMP